MRSGCSSPRGRRPFQDRILGASCILLLLLSGCNLPASPPISTQTPLVVTVVVTAANEVTPTGPTSTGMPSTSTPTELAPTPTFAPPPKPASPKTSAETPDGSDIENFRVSFDFSRDYFLRVYVFYSEDPNEQFKAKKDGRGIASVDISVTSADGGTSYYERTERNAGYCAFGGGEPDCNPWTFEDGQYRWKSGGPPVKSGSYGLTVTVTPDNGNSAGVWHWGDDVGNAIQITVP